ncbi:MAG: type I-U CRISPR-associated protein Cas5/Cas6 [Planctomycetes bacterium]|nr:type I-U CRISPR-associated protein Cas5/Cas6 [Planctomycetota bacterium]
MSALVFALTIHLHEQRFHGRPEWPPAPARAFQALVSGAAAELSEPATCEAFRWLERLDAPRVVAPPARQGRAVTCYVPNNDLDTAKGDPAHLDSIRVAKICQPRFLAVGQPIRYVWRFERGEEHARRLVELAVGLYQLGRSVDMAWAEGAIVDEGAVDAWAADRAVRLHEPSGPVTAGALLCPCLGTFDSLVARHHAQNERFRPPASGSKIRKVFVQPPRTLFRQVGYGRPSRVAVYEIRALDEPGRFSPWPLRSAQALVTRTRDDALARLSEAGLPEADLRATLVGPGPAETAAIPITHRTRILPLPSIGHEHADPRIRRIAVESHPDSLVRAEDIEWAFSGLTLDRAQLVRGDDDMLRHYRGPARIWETITPAALPAPRRRIDLAHNSVRGKSAAERATEEHEAKRAVVQALRHAGVQARPLGIEVQREPFRRKGERVEAFDAPPRFGKNRLWHVRIELAAEASGPMVLGDGRFLGLGIMVPVSRPARVHAWRIRDGLAAVPEPEAAATALRRAVMALYQEQAGPNARLPSWVTGHRADGSPAANDAHLFFACDPQRSLLMAIEPVRTVDSEVLQIALDRLTELRAGHLGRLALDPTLLRDDDPLLASSRHWRSATPYRVRRHSRQGDVQTVLRNDVRTACFDSGLPPPTDIHVDEWRAPSGRGLQAMLRLEFAAAVAGPMLLGKGRHRGMGLFVG